MIIHVEDMRTWKAMEGDKHLASIEKILQPNTKIIVQPVKFYTQENVEKLASGQPYYAEECTEQQDAIDRAVDWLRQKDIRTQAAEGDVITGGQNVAPTTMCVQMESPNHASEIGAELKKLVSIDDWREAEKKKRKYVIEKTLAELTNIECGIPDHPHVKILFPNSPPNTDPTVEAYEAMRNPSFTSVVDSCLLTMRTIAQKDEKPNKSNSFRSIYLQNGAAKMDIRCYNTKKDALEELLKNTLIAEYPGVSVRLTGTSHAHFQLTITMPDQPFHTNPSKCAAMAHGRAEGSVDKAHARIESSQRSHEYCPRKWAPMVLVLTPARAKGLGDAAR